MDFKVTCKFASKIPDFASKILDFASRISDFASKISDFLFFPRSGSAVGTLAPSFGGQGPTMGIAFGTFFFPP